MDGIEIAGRGPGSGNTLRILTESGTIVQGAEIAEESGLCPSSGFVDLQVNGFARFDINAVDLSAETVHAIVNALLANGVTCVAPTPITVDEKKISHAFQTIAQARRPVLGLNAVALVSMPSGTYDTPVGSAVEQHADGRLCLRDTRLVAGSTTTLSSWRR